MSGRGRRGVAGQEDGSTAHLLQAATAYLGWAAKRARVASAATYPNADAPWSTTARRTRTATPQPDRRPDARDGDRWGCRRHATEAEHGVGVKMSVVNSPAAWVRRNVRRMVSTSRGAGPILPAARIRRMVPAPTRWPRLARAGVPSQDFAGEPEDKVAYLVAGGWASWPVGVGPVPADPGGGARTSAWPG